MMHERLWRVCLIDSGGPDPGGGRFDADGSGPDPIGPDLSGHGSRIAALLACRAPPHDLFVGQVFDRVGRTTAVAVAAALHWALDREADLVHLSLGLTSDRPVLSAAVRRAVDVGCILVCSTPARGAAVYPAAYAGVIMATGDARCAPGEWSTLGSVRFGACARFDDARSGLGQGASIGAAHLTAAILACARPGASVLTVIDALRRGARYDRPERRQ
jgi:hypothetical protein